MKETPTIYLIAGCNGAGKTTFAMEFLPKEVKCLRFLNADEIARGLSPLDPADSAFKAGKILLSEFRECLDQRRTFAIESTLSGKTYAALFKEALGTGYEIGLHYLWLDTPERAVARVKRRAQFGGHSVPEVDIRRRFGRSRLNLLEIYLALATRWTIWDSQTLPPKPLASSERDGSENFKPMTSRKSPSKKKYTSEFVKSAERAFRRVAIKVRAEHRRHGLKPLVWPSK